MRIPIASLVLALALSADALDAQVFRGRVIEREGGTPVREAVVAVYDSLGLPNAVARTAENGAFTLRSPLGRVQVHVRRLGYAPKATPWLEVAAGDTITIEFDVERAAIVLTPQLIQSEREAIVNTRLTLGLDPRSIAGGIITPSMVEAHAAGARSYIDVVNSQGIVWAHGEETCVATVRRIPGENPCISVYLDGQLLANAGDVNRLEMARDAVSVSDIDYIVMLRPADAGVLFGTGSQNGVILIYTKHGQAARAANRARD